MTGYGRYAKRIDVIQRNRNKDETVRLINELGCTTAQICQALGLSHETVSRYRMELIAEGRIPNMRKKKS